MKRIIELYPGTAIYLAHLDELRERDINARVMDKSKFERLVSNLSTDKRLESLPLCRLNPNRLTELEILSGHHRVRASRQAGILEIYVLVIEDDVSDDAAAAKQLAHNAISGNDDAVVLQQIYESISDLNEKLRSGITEFEEHKFRDVKLMEVNFDFEFEVVNIMFLPSKRASFERAMAKALQAESVYLAEYDDFDAFKELVKAVQKHDNIRNISGIMARVSEIVLAFYEDATPATDHKEPVAKKAAKRKGASN